MSQAEYKGLHRNAAALADIAECRDGRIADLERQLAEAQGKLKRIEMEVTQWEGLVNPAKARVYRILKEGE